MLSTMMPTTAPLSMPPAHAPPTHNAQQDQLVAMFPEIEADVLASVLAAFNGDVEAAVVSLLETQEAPPSQEDQDVAFARALQQEMDEQVAHAVQKEMQDEAAAKRAAEPTVREAVSIEKAAASAASMTKSLTSKLLRPMSARRSASTSSHGARLLDSPGSEAAADFAPLQMPAYLAPLPMISDPSAQTAEVAEPPSARMSLSDTMTANATPGERYSSRVGRARAANQMAGRTSVGQASPPASNAEQEQPAPPPPPVAAAPYVPVGDLI